jgi:hypothetical protein
MATASTARKESAPAATGVNLDELQTEAERLVALLKDRQPGLMSWNGFLKERIDNMHRLTTAALA